MGDLCDRHFLPIVKASAPGKIILFGEHAVVYGRPALAVPVTQVHADVEILDSNSTGIWIHAPDINLHSELNALPSDHPIASVIHNFLFISRQSPSPIHAERSGSEVEAGGRAEVRPRLATKEDVDALWQNMDVIDCFATDHAPHTLKEKDSENPPPGFPGLETLLPLLLTAVDDGPFGAAQGRLLTIDDVIQKSVINPRKIFKLPEQPETWIEVDEAAEYEIKAADQFTRCGWTPFEGWKVKGKVRKVVLRGKTAFEDGKVLAEQGYGKNVRQ